MTLETPPAAVAPVAGREVRKKPAEPAKVFPQLFHKFIKFMSKKNYHVFIFFKSFFFIIKTKVLFRFGRYPTLLFFHGSDEKLIRGALAPSSRLISHITLRNVPPRPFLNIEIKDHQSTHFQTYSASLKKTLGFSNYFCPCPQKFWLFYGLAKTLLPS